MKQDQNEGYIFIPQSEIDELEELGRQARKQAEQLKRKMELQALYLWANSSEKKYMN